MARDTVGATTYRNQYRPPDFLIDRIDLDFTLAAAKTEVVSTLNVRRSGDAPRGCPLVLDGDELTLIDVAINGAQASAAQIELTEHALTLRELPDACEITIRTLCSPADNHALEGLYLTSGTFCTQCEAQGFRRITYFPDRPDVLARYRVTLRAPRAGFPVLLSNGNCVDTRVLSDGWHEATWDDPFPKPSYLFALVAGNLDVLRDTFTTASGRQVSLEIYAQSKHLSSCSFAMNALKRAMRWDEERYGREYDLDRFMIYCADDFNGGAMENKGLNIFNAALLLAKPETASDADFARVESVVAHEYFHNWSGNRVTCRDWFQLSLKEGFTVFRDQQFSADMGSAAVCRVEDVRFLRQNQFPVDASPLAHPVRPDAYVAIDNFYTTTIYEKGAEVVRMLHAMLGEEMFRAGSDLYFERHDGQAVTCDDFIAAMEAVSGRDLSHFKQWYDTPGTPHIHVRGDYDASAGTYTVNLTQRNPKSDTVLTIPLAMALLDPVTGRELAPTQVIELNRDTMRIQYDNIATRPALSLPRGFSAPVKIVGARLDDLPTLATHDSDGVVRWEAYNTLIEQAVLAKLAQQPTPPELHAVTAALLCDPAIDPALLGLMLSYPNPQDVESVPAGTSVVALVTALDSVQTDIATHHADALAHLFARTRATGAYRFETAEVGRRALHHAVLALRTYGANSNAAQDCVSLFEYADNMTDCFAALRCALRRDHGVHEALLAQYAARYGDDPLAMNKWFAVQAESPMVGTLSRLDALEHHRAFDIRNPNKIRALFGAFSTRNWARFHAADGTGYDYMAQKIVAIDTANPNVAARLVCAFERWKQFDATAQEQQKAALRVIVSQPGASRNVRELASKLLSA